LNYLLLIDKIRGINPINDKEEIKDFMTLLD
jgi:hypothetical protein